MQSVAWVAERKDLLSLFGGLLTIWSYLGYARNPSIGRFIPVLVFFILGLMAKPMLVTLPFVLLLLDYWPFNRSRPGQFASIFGKNQKGVTACWLVSEKIPFIIISGIAHYLIRIKESE